MALRFYLKNGGENVKNYTPRGRPRKSIKRNLLEKLRAWLFIERKLRKNFLATRDRCIEARTSAKVGGKNAGPKIPPKLCGRSPDSLGNDT